MSVNGMQTHEKDVRMYRPCESVAGNICIPYVENDLAITHNLLNLPKEIKKSGTVVSKYTYLSDGSKVSSCDAGGNGYMYFGTARFTLDNNVPTFESIPFSGGRIVKTTNGYEPQYYLTDHLGSTRAIVNKDGQTVTATFDYTPFGVQIVNSQMPTNSTEYRFSGKELQNVPDYEIYDFGARQYFPKYAIWGSVDPLSEKFPWNSSYVYCNNNPVLFIDPNGMEFSPALRKRVNGFIHEIDEEEERIRKKIQKIESLIRDNNPTGSQSKQLERLNQNLQELKNTRNEIDVLSASSQVYDLAISDKYDTEYSIRCFLSYDINSNSCVVNLSPLAGWGLFAHELKHAYQFEMGQLDVRLDKNKGRFLLYDKSDEIEAYNRGSLFGQAFYELPTAYSDLPDGPISATNSKYLQHALNNPQSLQINVNNSISVFRIQGTTYYPKSY